MEVSKKDKTGCIPAKLCMTGAIVHGDEELCEDDPSNGEHEECKWPIPDT